MTRAEAEKRLALSDKTVTAYEGMGGILMGSVQDRMRMIFEETQILHAIERDHPELAQIAKDLGWRYSRLAMQVKSQAN